jgi:hypothetical protein
MTEQTLPPVTGHAVIGWVHGEPVPSTALLAYMAGLAEGPVGRRLGVGHEPPAPGGPDRSKADALWNWGAKALLVDHVLRAEAARLGVSDPTSLLEWVDRLEWAGELSSHVPTEVEARCYYSANRSRFHVNEARCVRHVLVPDREWAERLREVAVDGPALGRLAAQVSFDQGSRRQGGYLGWVERGQLTGPLEDAIFSAEPHRVSGPVASAFGWHVIVVEALRPAGARPFDECRREIQAELAEYRRRGSWLAWLDRRIAETVRVPEGAEHPLFRGLPGSHHRH